MVKEGVMFVLTLLVCQEFHRLTSNVARHFVVVKWPFQNVLGICKSDSFSPIFHTTCCNSIYILLKKLFFVQRILRLGETVALLCWQINELFVNITMYKKNHRKPKPGKSGSSVPPYSTSLPRISSTD